MDYQNRQKILNIAFVLLLVVATFYMGVHSSDVLEEKPTVKVTPAIQQKKVQSSNNITATVRTLTPEEQVVSDIRSQYYNYIEYCISSNWKNPTRLRQHAALEFNLSKDGKLIAYDILQSSLSDEFTKSAIKALLDSAPFEPFPKALDKDVISFQVHFNGNSLNIASYANVQRLTYPVNQVNKPVKTKMDSAKRIRTMSSLPQDAPVVGREVARQIQYSWNPPRSENSSICISFEVMKNGTIKNIKFVNKSYNTKADKAALNAVKSVKIKPFSYTKDGFTMRYWFYVEDYDRG